MGAQCCQPVESLGGQPNDKNANTTSVIHLTQVAQSALNNDISTPTQNDFAEAIKGIAPDYNRKSEVEDEQLHQLKQISRMRRAISSSKSKHSSEVANSSMSKAELMRKASVISVGLKKGLNKKKSLNTEDESQQSTNLRDRLKLQKSSFQERIKKPLNWEEIEEARLPKPKCEIIETEPQDFGAKVKILADRGDQQQSLPKFIRRDQDGNLTWKREIKKSSEHQLFKARDEQDGKRNQLATESSLKTSSSIRDFQSSQSGGIPSIQKQIGGKSTQNQKGPEFITLPKAQNLKETTPSKQSEMTPPQFLSPQQIDLHAIAEQTSHVSPRLEILSSSLASHVSNQEYPAFEHPGSVKIGDTTTKEQMRNSMYLLPATFQGQLTPSNNQVPQRTKTSNPERTEENNNHNHSYNSYNNSLANSKRRLSHYRRAQFAASHTPKSRSRSYKTGPSRRHSTKKYGGPESLNDAYGSASSLIPSQHHIQSLDDYKGKTPKNAVQTSLGLSYVEKIFRQLHEPSRPKSMSPKKNSDIPVAKQTVDNQEGADKNTSSEGTQSDTNSNQMQQLNFLMEGRRVVRCRTIREVDQDYEQSSMGGRGSPRNKSRLSKGDTSRPISSKGDDASIVCSRKMGALPDISESDNLEINQSDQMSERRQQFNLKPQRNSAEFQPSTKGLEGMLESYPTYSRFRASVLETEGGNKTFALQRGKTQRNQKTAKLSNSNTQMLNPSGGLLKSSMKGSQISSHDTQQQCLKQVSFTEKQGGNLLPSRSETKELDCLNVVLEEKKSEHSGDDEHQAPPQIIVENAEEQFASNPQFVKEKNLTVQIPNKSLDIMRQQSDKSPGQDSEIATATFITMKGSEKKINELDSPDRITSNMSVTSTDQKRQTEGQERDTESSVINRSTKYAHESRRGKNIIKVAKRMMKLTSPEVSVDLQALLDLQRKRQLLKNIEEISSTSPMRLAQKLEAETIRVLAGAQSKLQKTPQSRNKKDVKSPSHRHISLHQTQTPKANNQKSRLSFTTAGDAQFYYNENFRDEEYTLSNGQLHLPDKISSSSDRYTQYSASAIQFSHIQDYHPENYEVETVRGPSSSKDNSPFMSSSRTGERSLPLTQQKQSSFSSHQFLPTQSQATYIHKRNADNSQRVRAPENFTQKFLDTKMLNINGRGSHQLKGNTELQTDIPESKKRKSTPPQDIHEPGFLEKYFTFQNKHEQDQDTSSSLADEMKGNKKVKRRESIVRIPRPQISVSGEIEGNDVQVPWHQQITKELQQETVTKKSLLKRMGTLGIHPELFAVIAPQDRQTLCDIIARGATPEKNLIGLPRSSVLQRGEKHNYSERLKKEHGDSITSDERSKSATQKGSKKSGEESKPESTQQASEVEGAMRLQLPIPEPRHETNKLNEQSFAPGFWQMDQNKCQTPKVNSPSKLIVPRIDVSPSSGKFGLLQPPTQMGQRGRKQGHASITTTSAHTYRSDRGFPVVNEYVMHKTLGTGQQGSVMIAFKLKNPEEKYAVKMINQNVSRSRRMTVGAANADLLNGRREMAFLRNVDHPYILKLYEIIDDAAAGHLYLVLELCHGNIYEKVKEHLTVERIRKYFRQLILALEYCHDTLKIIHRDIKPENILIDKHDDVKLADFGICEKLKEDGLTSSTRGTNLCFAPEAFLGKAFQGKRGDIWACGVTLYFMITGGKYPFSVANPNAISGMHDLSWKIQNEEPSYPPEIIDTPLLDLIKKILCKNSEDRITIAQIKEHPWITDHGREPMIDPTIADFVLPSQDQLSNPTTEVTGKFYVQLKKKAQEIKNQTPTKAGSQVRSFGDQ